MLFDADALNVGRALYVANILNLCVERSKKVP
jgi:hypothetical protein